MPIDVFCLPYSRSFWLSAKKASCSLRGSCPTVYLPVAMIITGEQSGTKGCY
jgi:hypothetical protein